MAAKQCRWCLVVKPLEDFYEQRGMTDGRMNKCKECVKAAVKDRYYRKHEDVAAYERERSQRPERRKNAIEYMRKMRREHPDKYKARTAVGNAIRDGRLFRKPCEVCGAEKVQAHHEDYSKPLDVHWLCFKCHREHAHGQVVSNV